MRHLRIALAAAVAASTSIVLFSTGTTSADNLNNPSYWEGQTEHPSQCVKHDPPSEQTSHGQLANDGKAVVLNEFNPDWPGDHWELLVVKAGSNDDGNAVYPHPVAGQEYTAPLNGGGQRPAVSHWIVCKGTSADLVDTTVSWAPTNGTCDSPIGSLAVTFDAEAVEYTGDPAGTYPTGTSVGGSFAALDGYQIVGAAGPFSHTFVDSDAPCDDEVTPNAVSFVDPTCVAPGVSVVGADDTDALDYTVTGTVAPGESVTVTVVAKDGYVLADGATTEWSHTFGQLDEGDCVVPANPQSSLVPACGSAQLTFSNDVGEIAEGFTAESATFFYSVDGGAPIEVVVAPNGSEQVPVNFDEDSGVHTVQIGEGQPVDIETNCEPDGVTTVAPVFVDPTCAEATAGLTLPDIEGVEYTTTGSVTPGSTVTVTATALEGYVLDGPSEWSYDYDAIADLECETPPEPSIDVLAFSQVCRADVPFVGYSITTSGTDATTAKLTFKSGDETVQVYEDQPLTGEVLYPGAEVDADGNPIDWPGWEQNDAGFWVEDETDAAWRDGLVVEVEVNPTATGSVTYPPASEACLNPPVTEPPTPTTVDTIPITTVGIGQAGPTVPAPQLPSTGSNATGGMVTVGALLLLAGAVLIGATRRRASGIR